MLHSIDYGFKLDRRPGENAGAFYFALPSQEYCHAAETV